MEHINENLVEYFSKFFQEINRPNHEVLKFLNNLTKLKLNVKWVNTNSIDENLSSLDNYYIKRYFRDFSKEILERKDPIRFITLFPNMEQEFFRLLTLTENQKIYHYTSLEALAKIIGQKRLRFSSIASLNDRSELSYFNDVIGLEKNNFHYKTIESFNSRYLLSCSELEDDLSQWRLYGDDGKGVCIELRTDVKNDQDYQDYYIGKIQYGEKVIRNFNKLIVHLLENENILLSFYKLNIWKHFFKSNDWSSEREIRVFNYTNKENSNITEWDINRFGLLSKYIYYDLEQLPVTISKIILGPKVLEDDLAIGQTKQFLKEQRILECKVEKSRITYYR